MLSYAWQPTFSRQVQSVPQDTDSEEYELQPLQSVHRDDAVLTSPDASPAYEAAASMPSAPPQMVLYACVSIIL